MRNPKFFTAGGITESLADLYYRNECSVIRIQDTVESCKTGAELVRKINALKLFEKFRLDRETPEYARLITTDCFGNTHYFQAYK